MPSFSFRAYPSHISNIFDVFEYILATISNLIPVITGLTVLVFLWGLFKLMTSAGSEADHDEGRNIMIYGIIGFFVMGSVWGLVAFLDGSFGFTGATTLTQ